MGKVDAVGWFTAQFIYKGEIDEVVSL